MKKRICYIVPRFHPFKGGAEKNLETMAVAMSKEGWDVTVFTAKVPFRNEKLQNTEKYRGIKIVRLWSLNNQLVLGFYPMLLPKLLMNRFDVIHTSGFGFVWIELCLMLKKLFSRKTKFINTPHGPFMATTNPGDGAKMVYKKFYTKVLRFILPKLYNRIIGVVDKQIKWLSEDYRINPSKIVIIPNGIEADYIEKYPPEFQPEDRVVISFINRMEWYKGIQDVIRALDIVRSHPDIPSGADNFKFLIMGREGSYTQKLKELVQELRMEEYIQFIFSPSDEERDHIFYEVSQINILPSKWEATGIALIEAMAKGNAIVTTFQNDAVDMLINRDSGFAYNFGDYEKLSEILTELITNYELRKGMIMHNLKFAKNFTWEEVLPKYVQMVKNLE